VIRPVKSQPAMIWSALSAESLVVCLLSPSASQPGSCMRRGPDGSLGFKPQVTGDISHTDGAAC
jgi:hypothetical protein